MKTPILAVDDPSGIKPNIVYQLATFPSARHSRVVRNENHFGSPKLHRIFFVVEKLTNGVAKARVLWIGDNREKPLGSIYRGKRVFIPANQLALVQDLPVYAKNPNRWLSCIRDIEENPKALQREAINILKDKKVSAMVTASLVEVSSEIKSFNIKEGDYFSNDKHKVRVHRVTDSKTVTFFDNKDRKEFKDRHELASYLNANKYKAIGVYDQVIKELRRILAPYLGPFLLGILFLWLGKKITK